MTILTRKDKEKLVVDLYYNQNKPYAYISKVARICPRDIKTILERASNNGESEPSKAVQAYRMFSEGKSPMEVAIALDLREPDVTQLYKESWSLQQLRDLNQMYLETRGYLTPLLRLYKSIKASGYREEHVDWLLGVANEDLPRLERRYHNLKSEVDSLEAQKQNLHRLIHNYRGQVTDLRNSVDYCRLRCEEEEQKLANLQTKRIKEENLVRWFENNNPEYIKIRRAVEENVRATLSNRKKLLELAALSLIESIRENPEKYSSLIPLNIASPYFNSYYMYAPQQPIQSKVYFTEDYVAMLSEDADKILEKLVKELGDDVISDYIVSSTRPSSLPMLSHSDGGFSPAKERK